LKRLFLVLIAVLLGGANAALESKTPQASQKWDLHGVLGMMDKSAKDFHSLTADIEHIKYTDVVKDTSTESGKI